MQYIIAITCLPFNIADGTYFTKAVNLCRSFDGFIDDGRIALIKKEEKQ
jgi:hypothetical protein